MEKLYVERQLSLQDIADRYGCTRVLVYYLMKEYGIPRRTHSKARRLAQRAGKIEYTVQLADGGTRRIRQSGTNIDTTFFHEWSPEMAYVLGVFYTDGCFRKSANGYYSASISQKEPELLEKCLSLMDCDAQLSYRPDNSPAGGLYTFTIHDQGVCRCLLARGLHPRKSLTIQFPDMPSEVVRHFIRGCWDGDGSVGRYGRCWQASYCSGSQGFITHLHNSLVALGMTAVKLSRHNYAVLFRIKWSGRACGRLFRILYEDVPATQYLTRKYTRFRLADSETCQRPPSPGP